MLITKISYNYCDISNFKDFKKALAYKTIADVFVMVLNTSHLTVQ